MVSRIRLAKGVHIYRRPDAKNWWADLSKNGQRIKRNLGTENRKAAEAEARALFAQIGDKPSGLTLIAALADWFAERPRTHNEKSAVRVLLAAYPDRPASEVDNASLRAALADKKAAWYNRIITIVRAALNLAYTNGKLGSAPKLSRRHEEPPKTRFLSPDEYSRLRAALPAHLIPPFEFSLATGQRQANVMNLKWSQIHGNLMIIDAASYKQRRNHAIPLGEYAMKILDGERGKHPEFVFTYRGKPFKSPAKAFRVAKQTAGVPDFTWHGLRHTFASWMLIAGAPLVAVKEAGGWSDMQSVARYAHLEKKQLAQYADHAMDAITERHRNGTTG
jgi:integrase